MTARFCNTCSRPFPVRDNDAKAVAPKHETDEPTLVGDSVSRRWVTCPGSGQPLVAAKKKEEKK